MAVRRTKSDEKLKKEKEQRNFNLAEIEFIKANAPEMTVDELADALNAKVSEVEELIRQYNHGTGNMTKDSYIGRDKKGVVIATQASSALSDKTSADGGVNNVPFIRPKVDHPSIFRLKPDSK